MYKIKSLRLKNFKSYKTERIFEFGDLNLLFGTNGSGKSSVFDALKFINNILVYKDQHYGFFGSNRNRYFGGFKSVVSKKDESETILISLRMVFDDDTPSVAESTTALAEAVDRAFPSRDKGMPKSSELSPEGFEKYGVEFLCKDRWEYLKNKLSDFDSVAAMTPWLQGAPQDFEVAFEVAKYKVRITVLIGDIEYCNMVTESDVVDGEDFGLWKTLHMEINKEHPFVLANSEFFKDHINDAILRYKINELNKYYFQYKTGSSISRTDPSDWVVTLIESKSTELDWSLLKNMYRAYQAKGCSGFEINFDTFLSRKPHPDSDEYIYRRDRVESDFQTNNLLDYINIKGNDISIYLSGSGLVDSLYNERNSYYKAEDFLTEFSSLTGRQNSLKHLRDTHTLMFDSIHTPLAKMMKTLSSMLEVEEIRPILPENHQFGVIDTRNNIESIQLWDAVVNNDILAKDVNSWLRKLDKYIELEETSLVETDKRGKEVKRMASLRVRDISTNVTYAISEMASGISQVLPILFAALHKEKTMSIKQPELHIHPKNQLILGDLFLDSAFRRGNQLFIETHSEHIILRILRRIRKQYEGTPYFFRINTDKINVIYISKEGEESIPRRQEMTKDGDFAYQWPDGFFDERDEELF